MNRKNTLEILSTNKVLAKHLLLLNIYPRIPRNTQEYPAFECVIYVYSIRNKRYKVPLKPKFSQCFKEIQKVQQALKKLQVKNAEGFLKTFSPEMKKSKSEYLKLV